MSEAMAPKALAPGSPLWWARLFALPERRSAFDALLAIRGELVTTALGTTDPNVAGAKLSWWREELRRFGSGGEQHPATRALASAEGGRDVEPEYLEEMLDGAEMDVAHRPCAAFSELRLYCHRTSGVLQELLVVVTGTDSPRGERAVRNAAHRLGIGLRLAELACDFPADLKSGRLYLPGDWLDDAGVSDDALVAERPDPALAACLSRLAGEARQALDDAMADWPKGQKKRHRHAMVLADLAKRRLDQAEALSWIPATTAAGATRARRTLGDLVTAWRAARRAVREG
ncbi:MAG: squalene/phytoene synthase family protein [Gammaproteobacteria bacterium]